MDGLENIDWDALPDEAAEHAAAEEAWKRTMEERLRRVEAEIGKLRRSKNHNRKAAERDGMKVVANQICKL